MLGWIKVTVLSQLVPAVEASLACFRKSWSIRACNIHLSVAASKLRCPGIGSLETSKKSGLPIAECSGCACTYV